MAANGVMLGPSASEQWRTAPHHLAMVLARYRAAAALIGNARTVLELGCGEGIGARLLADGRELYHGVDYDAEAIAYANEHVRGDAHGGVVFSCADVRVLAPFGPYDAIVTLDVIEHMTDYDGALLVGDAAAKLGPPGVLVVGTPNADFDHLASEASRREHVYTYHHDDLYFLLREKFTLVQSFGMQDTALHFGHPAARHYLLMAGLGVKHV
jgi:2-polyprenyl-3-methyl-5-hydroxy-6-metoxy-1,4-benzoquinol methylase